MRIIEIDFSGEARVPVDGYAPGGFRVGGRIYHGPVALLPGGPLGWAGLPDIEDFLERRAEFDVLLMGMGAEIAGLPNEVRRRMENERIRFEIMATPPACRTYNVLLGEGRRVAAALMPIDPVPGFNPPA